MADINVTMTVDTSALSAGASGSAVAAACTLTDDNGDPSGSSGFNIRGEAGQTVAFTIVASDGSTAVNFNQFVYESGDSGVFNPLPSSSNSWIGTISGSVGDDEFFYIDFNVPTIQSGAFRLDPEISIKPPA